jgi:hypothetical protein
MHTVVSSPAVENVELVVAPKANKPKKLSAKYEKFLVFGYWFVEQLKQQNIAVDETVLHQQLTMFSSVEEQTQYFEAFFEQLKTSTKSMKALIKEHNKPPAKAKKTKKEPTDKPAAKKTNGRKKKNAEVINDKQDELVAELVAAAQTEEVHEQPLDDKPKRKYSRKPKTKPTEEPTNEHIVEAPNVEAVLENVIEAIKEPLADKPKKKTAKKNTETETKPKEVKETKPKEVKETKPKEVKETKPKEVKETKTKKTKKAAEPVKETFVEPSPVLVDNQQQQQHEEEDEEEEEEEIQVQTFVHKGIHYLRDFNNNIYDKDTCEVIGIYDPSSDVITIN